MATACIFIPGHSINTSGENVKLVAKAHTICPYSKATRGNIEVKLLANGKPVENGAK